MPILGFKGSVWFFFGIATPPPLKRSGIAWNRFILMLGVSPPICGPPGRPERQLEDISKCAGERVRLWRQIGKMSDNERFFKSA